MSYIILKIMLALIAGILGTACIVVLGVMLTLSASVIWYCTGGVRHLIKNGFTQDNLSYLGVLELAIIISVTVVAVCFFVMY